MRAQIGNQVFHESVALDRRDGIGLPGIELAFFDGSHAFSCKLACAYVDAQSDWKMGREFAFQLFLVRPANQMLVLFGDSQFKYIVLI